MHFTYAIARAKTSSSAKRCKRVIRAGGRLSQYLLGFMVCKM
jgi:hypothetical protein